MRTLLWLIPFCCLTAISMAEQPNPKNNGTANNNPLQVNGHNFYGADPSVVVANDGRLFLFPTTDNRDWEKQFGWSCYSTRNLVDWKDHGVVFSNENSNWGVNKAWAPDIIQRDGKYYLYYYFNNGGNGKGGVGVAVADAPEGPFTELTTERLCRGHDPAVFGDDDGRYWLYLQDKVYELGDDMASLKSGPMNLNLDYRPEKFEAAYVFKRNDLYYFTIARGWNNLIYYTGKRPAGPFKFRGEFMKPYGGNNHHSIVKYKDRWMIFYHEWVKNDPVHQRQLRAEFLRFKDDGTIELVEPTDQGVTLTPRDTATVAPHPQESGWKGSGLMYSGNVDWDPVSGTASFHSSGTITGENDKQPDQNFFWRVPSLVKRIEIDSGVTVRGGFRVLYRDASDPLWIVGKDRKSSVIKGTDQQQWTANKKIDDSDKWLFSAVSVIEDAVVKVSNLTSSNPMGYHISGYANQAVVHVDSCDLIDSRGGDGNNSDGFAGKAGSSIRNSFISTSDDAIKVYHDITIENVTIQQHRNGAPLQFGWYDETPVVTASIKNLTIRGVAADNRYNMAPLTWEGGKNSVRHVNIDGLVVDVQGKVYDEAKDAWLPVGLLELKPTGCTFDLTVRQAKLNGIARGINHTKGTIIIEEAR